MIVPPCINKYYILDLQPENSYVRWAVGEGHTVFMLSWRNIPPELGRITWDDYLEQGVLTAISVAREIADSKTVNALGFCVGGTLLACALAAGAARGERAVASVTPAHHDARLRRPGRHRRLHIARISSPRASPR